MDVALKNSIAAAITLHADRVTGGIPVFIARDTVEQKKLAGDIARIISGVVHDLQNGTYIVVKH